MGKGRTLIRGTLLLTLSGLAMRGLSVLFQAVLAGRIGAEGMGILQLILTVGGFAGTLGSAGIRVAALQLTARAWGRRDTAGVSGTLWACLRYGFLVSATAGLGLCLLAGPISLHLLRDARTAPALRLLGLLLPLPILSGILRSAFTACGRVRELVAVELAERLLSVGTTLALLSAAGADPALLCAAVVFGSYGASAFSFALLLRRFTRTLPRRKQLPPVAGTAIPLGANDALRSGLGAVEQFLIPYGLEKTGSRQTALAAYGTISGMVFPLLWFPSEILFALSELMVSETARLLACRDRTRLRALVRKSLALTAVYAIGISAILYLGGGLLGRALFHSAQAGWYLRIFAPMILFLYPDAVVDGLQKGLGQQLHQRHRRIGAVAASAPLWNLGLCVYLLSVASGKLLPFPASAADCD